MGGSSGKQKVGNRYEAGFHVVACRQADALLAIRANDEVMLWEGRQGQGRIDINKLNAFGGDEREGGFSGSVDVMLGANDQTVNDYLSSVLGALVPAYRGVVSFVYRRPYVSANTARLPVLSHKVLNVEGIHRGWLPELAIVNSTSIVRDASIYIALDMSLSMNANRIQIQSEAFASYIRSLKGEPNNIRVALHSSGVTDSIERLDCTDDDYEDIALWIEALTIDDRNSGGDWSVTALDVEPFIDRAESVIRQFNTGGLIRNTFSVANSILSGVSYEKFRRIMVLTTDGGTGETTAQDASNVLSPIDDLEIFVMNIDEADTVSSEILDNTAADGVPVVNSLNADQITAALNSSFTSWADMNPMHVIRCLQTDPMRGGTIPEAEIGDSYAVLAQKYFDEGFGVSVKLRGLDFNIQDRQEVERHIDAVTYRSATTGKWEAKAIDEPFTVGDLETLDSSIVVDWSGFSRPEATEIPNQLTVTFTKRINGDKGAVTRTNVAGVRRQGRIIKAQDAHYPSITREDLATRVCLRDIRSLSKRLWNGTLELTHLPESAEIGSRFILNEPELRINNVIVVVSEVRHGDSTDARAWITVSEDKYSGPSILPETDFEAAETVTVLPVLNRVVSEANYYTGVKFAGQTALDNELEIEPDLGRLITTGAAPSNEHIDFSSGVDVGAGFEDEGVGEFEPYGVLNVDLIQQADVTTFTIDNNATLLDIQVGDLARIGDEIIRIDSFADDPNGFLVTVGRGCLDTVPQEHSAGSVFVVTQNVQPLETDYIGGVSGGQAVDVKLISRTSQKSLSIAQAPTDTVQFRSRAIRPYPPGQLQANGSYESDVYYPDVVLTWAHRDRTLQTTPNVEDHTFGNIGPEAGTTYNMTVDALDLQGDLISNLIDTDLGLVTTYDWDDATVLPAGTVSLRFGVDAVRDGYDSWQTATITVLAAEPSPVIAPGSVTVTEMSPEPPTNVTVVEL